MEYSYVRFITDVYNFMDVIEKLQEAECYFPLYNFTTTLYNNTIKSGGKIMFMGNGGSAADCDHIVGELRGRFLLKDRPAITALSLTDSIATTTALANDIAYDYIFSHQLSGMYKPNDSIIALSTSGSSKNINIALDTLKFSGQEINSLLITGKTSLVNTSVKYHVMIPLTYKKENVPHIQECTMFLLHTMCMILESLISGES